MAEKLDELYTQIQQASRLNYIVGVEVMRPIFTYAGTINEMFQTHSVENPLPNDTHRLHLRFCPSVSAKKVSKIKKHIESNYGYQCSLCEWSLPVRLEVYLK